MANYDTLTREELTQLQTQLSAELETIKSQARPYSLTRGVPSKDMLDLAMPMLDSLGSEDDYLSPGLPGQPPIDARNYGVLEGLPVARQFMADIMAVPMESVMVGGNASLSLMHTALTLAYAKGLYNSPVPWSKLDTVKILVPAPGYDRHFGMCAYYGAQLIPIAMTPTGPDMDMVEELVKDPAVRGLFCVPKYSNPTGVTYCPDTVKRLASLQPSAVDFCLWYDNAYELHDFNPTDCDRLLPIWPELVASGRTNQVIQFTSLSKVTFAGGSMASLSTGAEQLKHLLDFLGTQIISFDKINQLRHVQFLKDRGHLTDYMATNMALAKPKFDLCQQLFETELYPTGTTWSQPKGGYFISVDTKPGLATVVTQLAKDTGLTLLSPGSTFPNDHDPLDGNIRIAPTAIDLKELAKAMQIFVLCVKLATVNQLLGVTN